MALHTTSCQLYTHTNHLNQTVRHCQTHGIEVGPHDYQCKVGSAVQSLASQAEYEISVLKTQITTLEHLLNHEPVKTFLHNLTKLHEKDPTP